MDYTTWRITYQSAEQAARAAYKSAQQHLQLVENLRYAGNRVIRGGEGTHVWDLALKALPEESPLHARIEELEEQASKAAAERDELRRCYHTACEELQAMKAALVGDEEEVPTGPAISLVEQLKAERDALLPLAKLFNEYYEPCSSLAQVRAKARQDMLPLVELLGAICRAAYYVADDGDADCVKVPHDSMGGLELALEACELLTEPEEGLVSDGWFRALRTLRLMAEEGR